MHLEHRLARERRDGHAVRQPDVAKVPSEIIDFAMQLISVIFEVDDRIRSVVESLLQTRDQRLLCTESPRDGPELTKLRVVRTADQRKNALGPAQQHWRSSPTVRGCAP